ncbi:DUF3141 domain-containing protein [Chitinibacter tainanensis]|uniref:DUF3141 domain-containing protein n=1 Tax=Chitinibacter tainanensis TaxID=230667 RepID=UPI0023543C85|nr:DUF3141 domain-containing protein [Chitinibacter tainanensis]
MLVSQEKTALWWRLNEKVFALAQQNLRRACETQLPKLLPPPLRDYPLASWLNTGAVYWQDSLERQALYWDTLRERGDQFLQHEAAGKPPVLKFAYELVVDARTFAQPVNYALVRITPPAVVTVNPASRPYVVIDPRAGHGPGIGGFKAESEIGVALQAGHPVYAVIFFPIPEPGQTLADVTSAETEFLRYVRQSHPDAPKPVLIGNCQGGWAALLVAASSPELVGAVVANGAPVSYWAGNDNNPMRYAGGMLGGSWLALLAADLGNGLFDGAHLVSNFENLDLGNTLVSKHYHLYDQIDTEAPRFLDFERWWGANYLMNAAEIRWIVDHLFIGNDLVEGKAQAASGAYDLTAVHAPVVIFASLGDNITPPQQAFNWILDLYPSTDALKAAGQVVVGLVHESIGHLGIFVSAGVASKEHAQIVELMTIIETLPPGLYALQIEADADGGWRAQLQEHPVESLHAHQRFDRRDELAFAAVESVSAANMAAYEQWLRPWVQACSNDLTATLGRLYHPLRLQRWAWSSLNPLALANSIWAEQVRQQRQAPTETLPWRALERQSVQQLAAGLDWLGALRDIQTETAFLLGYGTLTLLGVGQEHQQAGQLPTAESAATAPSPATAPASESPTPLDLQEQLQAGDANTGLIRLGLLLQGEQIDVQQRQLSVSWLRTHTPLAELDDDTLATLIHQQSLLLWHWREAAIDTLPTLFGSKAALERAFKLYQALAKEHAADLALSERLSALRKTLLPTRRRGKTDDAITVDAA